MRPATEVEESETTATLVLVEQRHSNALPSKLPFPPHVIGLILLRSSLPPFHRTIRRSCNAGFWLG